MNAEPDDSVVQAWARLTRAQRMILASIEQALKSAGLPPLVWYDVLLELERAGDRGLRPFELEREMLLAQYNLSRLIERIEKAGYAERRACEGDGRGQIFHVGQNGCERGRLPLLHHLPAQRTPRFHGAAPFG